MPARATIRITSRSRPPTASARIIGRAKAAASASSEASAPSALTASC